MIRAACGRQPAGEWDHDFEIHVMTLDTEWRVAYEASRIAGAEFLALSASPKVKFADLQKARSRLDQAEERKAQILSKIERFEAVMTQSLQINE